MVLRRKGAQDAPNDAQLDAISPPRQSMTYGIRLRYCSLRQRLVLRMFPGTRVDVATFRTFPAFPKYRAFASISDLEGVKQCAGVAKIKNLSAEQEQAPASELRTLLPYLLTRSNRQSALVR